MVATSLNIIMGRLRTRPPTGDTYTTIGRRIAQLRKARGIRQTEMAEHLGVTQGKVSAYERGSIRVSCDLLVEISKLLKTSPDELLGFDPPSRVNKVKDQRLLTRMLQIDRLPKRDKDALLHTINAFLDRLEMRPASRSDSAG